jgi:hypothetical protein
MSRIVIAAGLALALASISTAQAASEEYSMCKTRAQDHCRVAGSGHGHHHDRAHLRQHHDQHPH